MDEPATKQAPVSAEQAKGALADAKRRGDEWAAELRRRNRAAEHPDIERPPVAVTPIPEAMRRYHPDGSYCARGWPCTNKHLRGRPGDPEPVPVRVEVMECIGQPTDTGSTPDGLYLQTVYGVGTFVMERDDDGTVREVAGPFVSGMRCQSIIDGMRIERMWLPVIAGEHGIVIDDPRADEVPGVDLATATFGAPEEVDPTVDPRAVPKDQRHYYKDGSWCPADSLCDRAHMAPELMKIAVQQRKDDEAKADMLDRAYGNASPAPRGAVIHSRDKSNNDGDSER